MAKSIRSKIKHKFKKIRRAEIYGPVEEARLHRLAKKQAALVPVEAEGIVDEVIQNDVDGMDQNKPQNEMDLDQPKISLKKPKSFRRKPRPETNRPRRKKLF